MQTNVNALVVEATNLDVRNGLLKGGTNKRESHVGENGQAVGLLKSRHKKLKESEFCRTKDQVGRKAKDPQILVDTHWIMPELPCAEKLTREHFQVTLLEI
jgi:hypothetical protein